MYVTEKGLMAYIRTIKHISEQEANIQWVCIMNRIFSYMFFYRYYSFFFPLFFEKEREQKKAHIWGGGPEGKEKIDNLKQAPHPVQSLTEGSIPGP